MSRSILGTIAAGVIGIITGFSIPQAVPVLQATPAPVIIHVPAGVTCLTMTPTASPTATRTPTVTATATPSRTPTATATRTPVVVVTPTPLEVTPIGGTTPIYPRTIKAEVDYVPLYNLIIRTSPAKTATNATTERALADTLYMVWNIREYADGSAWGCLTEIEWQSCRRWMVIEGDLSPIDGVLELYAVPASEQTN